MAGMVEKAYSEAVFQLGMEENCIDTLCDEISQLSEIFSDSPELVKLLCAPTISLDEKSDMAKRIFKGKVSDYTMNFILVLVEKNRIGYFPKIADELKKMYNEHNGIVEVTVTTVEPLKAEIRNKLINKLEDVTGKKITLIEKIDKTIIGGIVLNYGNTQLDSSIKSRIDGMHAKIKAIIA